MTMTSPAQFTLWKVGPQEVHVDFSGGRIVSDAGLLALRSFDKHLGIIAGFAALLGDPRSPRFITHGKESLVTQEVYQILAGYPDGNDADTLRHDPLFKTLVDHSADEDSAPLASCSTLNRFLYAYSRRDAALPPEDRPILLEQQTVLCQRLTSGNDYLVDLFIRTRLKPPSYVILDLDGTDDPTHGQQVLSGYHGYFGQHQYFPLYVYDGATGFPLAAWLRPGTIHGSYGAVDTLRSIIARLRKAWPGVLILVRADNGFAVPEMYEFCEREGLLYALGYASNDVLQARTDGALWALQTYYHWYGYREPHVQHFESIEDYQAGTWPRPRRIVAKIEITPQGINRRFVVTNMSGHPQGIYHGFYVKRGEVPESPIGECKNGLQADRLSMHRFRANGMKLLLHTLAYALLVLYREASSAVKEMAKAEVSTWRQRLWKVGAVVVTSAKRVWFHMSTSWPFRQLWVRVHEAAMSHAQQLRKESS
ncbi:MAG: IS1380 family transposase [Acidobacteriaceae bacterium]|nr:IS1380 family transposase [Acidobacteriaceae bacterium]